MAVDMRNGWLCLVIFSDDNTEYIHFAKKRKNNQGITKKKKGSKRLLFNFFLAGSS
jgi:hypothetical protein